jgi:hypothetical protein
MTFQSYNWVLESVSSPNCALNLIIRISAGITFLLVRSLTIMHCTTVEGTTYSLIVISTDKKQVNMQ